MVDMAAIAGMAASLRSAAEITKAMIGLRDAAMIQSKVIELQGVILAAQSNALAAQSDQFSLLERVRQLEEQIAGLEAWEAQKKNYELKEVYRGAFAYVRKPDSSGTEPPHWVCAACFEKHRRVVLQDIGFQGREKVYQCPECKSPIRVHFKYNPRTTWHPDSQA